MAITEYFIKRKGSVSGPFTLQLVLAGIKIGKVLDSDSVGNTKTGPWLSVAVFRLNYAGILVKEEISASDDNYFEEAAARRRQQESDRNALVEYDNETDEVLHGNARSFSVSKQRGEARMEDEEVAFLQAAFDPSFRSFVTPRIVRFLFMLTAFVLMPLGMIAIILGAANNGGVGAALGAAIGCVIGYVIIVLYLRVASEIAIVLFRIERNTR